MESVCQSVRHDSMPLHTTCTLVQRHTGHFKQAAGDSPWVKECLIAHALIRVPYRGLAPRVSRPHWIRNQVAEVDASIYNSPIFYPHCQ